MFRAAFWEGDATKHFSVKKGVFSEKGGGNSVNEWFGEDFYRKDNSVKRFGPFNELPDFENWKVAVLIPFPKITSHFPRNEEAFGKRGFSQKTADSGCSHIYLMLQLQHQLFMPDNSVIAVTDYSYSF